ncbi:hypothetical protein Aph01nite_09210 [Acrocarpospora phusangensis]|uniref:Uncharacterized protein n=1 Tax=Acrocarpospora phusangensis TaxID=1070424 RepID=A0A919Q6R6_9ACTN|nr:YbfB/YjiJ family MFS transporter [Acrocarpospora phusangensis]GIH22611.1 hypothetical protein Aph01nite_09210 [Acrocarpospora phusangensis]
MVSSVRARDAHRGGRVRGDRPWRIVGQGAAALAAGMFVALLVSYTLEGAGYIIAGTFLVAAVGQSTPGWAGSGAWILAGLAALPSTALWARLSRTRSRPALLRAALAVQAVGIALPALTGGVWAALVSAALFGATFLGVATLTLGIGAGLRVPRSVAILTTGYSAGQIIGPVIVTPLLPHGYAPALLVGAALVVLAAAVASTTNERNTNDQHRNPYSPDRSEPVESWGGRP